ncbi:MAG: FkbM family methyltransferase [Opitutaceae bacterium]|nr:FkbM family methyltransferase [Opitutaceae bacterium]
MKKFIKRVLAKFKLYLKHSRMPGFRLLGWELYRDESNAAALRPLGESREFLAYLRNRGFQPQGIIDVGANRGGWATFAREVFPAAAIILIEPQDEMEKPLEQVSAKLGNCIYVKAGAGRENGELTQTIFDDLAGSSFLPAIDKEKVAAHKQRQTTIVTIDHLVTDLHPSFVPDLVKLDIQGFELEALRGASALYGRTQMFIVEISLYRFMPDMPLARDIIMFMGDRGYELYDVVGFLHRPSDNALGQLDLVFVQAEGEFRKSAKW